MQSIKDIYEQDGCNWQFGKRVCFVQIWTTIDTRSVINHCSLLPHTEWENTSKIFECCNSDWHTKRAGMEISLKAMPPLSSNIIILQKAVSCVWDRRTPPPPERWRSPRIGRQLLETGRYYGGSTTPTTTLATTALLLLLDILPVLRYYCYYCTAFTSILQCFLLWDSIIQGTVERIG